MGGLLFASDLDNTLLFSYRRRREGDVCVEMLDGREQGFCTTGTLERLARVRERLLFVPVTSRSIAQYRRIVWPEACAPRYAVTTNGGILLDGGVCDPAWEADSRALTAPWRRELARLEEQLEEAPVPWRFRMVDGLYLFAACDNAKDAEAGGRFFQGRTGLEVAVSGRKVYFFPPPLNKGQAIRRLRERFGPDRVVCAGDSVIDAPMLREADDAVFPEEALAEAAGPGRHWVPKEGERFPDFVMETVNRILEDPEGENLETGVLRT